MAGQEGLLYSPSSIDFHPDGLNDDDASVDLGSNPGEENRHQISEEEEEREAEEKILDETPFFPFGYYERIPSTGRHNRREIDNNSPPELALGRRAFSPWGGKKRYFNPWGGKRVRGVRVERKTDSVFDKRPGFQPWGGKRGEKRGEKRAFNPWGGKRDSPLRSRDAVSGNLDGSFLAPV